MNQMPSAEKIISKGIALLCLVMIISQTAGYLLFQRFFAEHYFPQYPFVILFYIIIGSISISVITKATLSDNRTFTNIFMVLKVAKLIILVLFFMVLALMEREKVTGIACTLVVFYVIYTIFETMFSIKLNRLQNEPNKKQNN